MAWSAAREKSAYVAAKHGLMGLTKVGAIELANTGVTVNAICPGWVLTPLVQAQIDRRAAEGGTSAEAVAHAMLTEKQPMAQFTTPAGARRPGRVPVLGRGADHDRGAAVDGWGLVGDLSRP